MSRAEPHKTGAYCGQGGLDDKLGRRKHWPETAVPSFFAHSQLCECATVVPSTVHSPAALRCRQALSSAVCQLVEQMPQ